jgi:hypothetical protein
MTQRVCESFFNFDGDLNRGHDVVAALYSLIYDCKDKNYSHFKYLEKQISRSSRYLTTQEEFSNLFRTAVRNVTDDYGPEFDVSWTVIAYMFYVGEKVDLAAQRTLNPIEYNSFKRNMISDFVTKLTNVFADNLTEMTWKTFTICQTFKSINRPFHWFEFCLGVSTVFLYKIINC